MRRLPKPKGPGGLSLSLRHPGQSVLSFLWSVYHSAAEGMPNKMRFTAEDRQTQDRPPSCLFVCLFVAINHCDSSTCCSFCRATTCVENHNGK